MLTVFFQARLKVKKICQYHILRYRDDYRIFVNDSKSGENYFKNFSWKTLMGLGMRLNAEKTMGSDDIISSSIKKM